MAQLVKEENGLLALEVGLDTSGGDKDAIPGAYFEVQRGTDTRARFTASPRELGLPTDTEPDRWTYLDPAFTLPGTLADQLRDAVLAEAGGHELLWLNLAIPAGFTAMLPWEHLLREHLPMPVVRVPNFALHPVRDTDEIDIVLCVSQPEAKLQFDAVRHATSVVKVLLERLPTQAKVHVFADPDTGDALRSRWAETPGTLRTVTVYQPPDKATIWPEGPTGSGTAVSSPWLRWIVHALAGHTVELVHFIGHSYLSGYQPSIALARSPVRDADRSQSRFAVPRQVASFLDAVGAWAAGISSPAHDFSPVGSRLFVDELSRERVGPIVHHPLHLDPEAKALGDIYASIFSGTVPPGPSDVALYCHPRLFRDATVSESLSYAESLLGSTMASFATALPQPAWATLTKRTLEQSAAMLFPETSSPGTAEQAAGDGVRAALDFVNGVLAQSQPDTAGATMSAGSEGRMATGEETAQ
jgi:hypothetical protein